MIDFKVFGRFRSDQKRSARISNSRVQPAQQCARAISAISIALAVVTMAGCATSGAGEVGYVAPPKVSAPTAPSSSLQPPASKVGAVVGVWEGESRANCSTSEANRCNAQQKIRLTMVEGEAGLVGGYYRCGYGTMNCYNMNETGKIVRATVNGGQMTARVQMPDGTSCLYTGRTAGNDIVGGYSCYGGGALLESGSWRGKRSY
jgi:hypothetical protein